MEQLNKNPKEFADIKDVKLDDAYHRRLFGAFTLGLNGFRRAQCAAGAQEQDFEILDKPEQKLGESNPREAQELKKRCSWFRRDPDGHHCRKNRNNDATTDLKPQFVSMEGVSKFSDLSDDKKQALYEMWQNNFRINSHGEVRPAHQNAFYSSFPPHQMVHHRQFRCRLGKNYQNEIPVGDFKPWVGWDFKRDQF